MELVNKTAAGEGERRVASESGNGQSEIIARHAELPVVEPVDSAPELPEKPAGWWTKFIFHGALMPKADATLALRLVLGQLQISTDERALDFPTDNIVQTTFCEALEKLTGGDLGWRTVTQIYDRQLERERRRVNR